MSLLDEIPYRDWSSLIQFRGNIFDVQCYRYNWRGQSVSSQLLSRRT